MAKEFPVKWRFGVVDKLTGPVKRMTKAFSPVTKAAKKANIQFKLMQRNTAKLRKNISGFGKGMQSVGKSMTVGLTAPIAAFGALTIKTAVDFEASMNKISALTKATGKPLIQMRELAKKMGAETQFSASQAADAMAFLGQAGFKTNEILKATPAILNLAAASNTDLATSADIASNIMGAFGLKAKDMTRIADVLAATTASSNVDMAMLAETMKAAAPVAKQFGLSIEETSSAVGLLGNVGIQGSMAGTTLKNMMLNLAAPTSAMSKSLTEIGVKTSKSNGEMRSLTDILGDMGGAMKKLPKAKQLEVLKNVFGKVAIAGGGELVTQALVLGKDGKNAIQRFTDELKNSDGAAERMAKTMQKGAPGAVKALGSAFAGLQIAIGESGVLEMFTNIVMKITEVLRTLAKANPAFLKMGAIAAVVVAALGPLLIAFGTLIAFIPTMMTGFSILKTGFIAMKIAAVAFGTSVGALLLPLTLLATAGFMIMKEWKPIKQFFADLFTNPLAEIKDMASFAGDLAKKAGAFLGFGSGEDDTDAKLKAQGFNIQGPAGAEVGATKLTKKSDDFKIRQQKAQVDINFANMPKDSNATVSDKESIINVSTGAIGAI